MRIELKDITKENYREASFLTTNEDGQVTLQEGCLMSNVFSLAELSFIPNTKALALYHEEVMIGFTFIGEKGNGEFWIFRYMLDHKYHGQGFGRVGFQKILNYIDENYSPNDIYISFYVGNDRAQYLYESFGFTFTNIIENNEKYYVVNRKKS
ncbi:GNAT family N-acetyltransferase [Erysipelothrix urinaevulpis]|uniref:GNAT family N-acetyltransferase n=1 Tax=Erysipelothrix urinaevulpis TaxID=2683717 RepID=UPI00135B02CD|nr:GNAT family protein [Erysipelothrix urinaevulpis]